MTTSAGDAARRLSAAAALVLLCVCACRGGGADERDRLEASAAAALRRGDLAQALTDAQRGSALAGGDAHERAAFDLLAAESLLLQRDIEGADRLLQHSGRDLPPALAAKRRMLEGQRAVSLGQFGQAVAILEDAITRAGTAGAVQVALQASALLGQALLRAGKWDAGEAVLRQALERAVALGDGTHQAAMLVNLGMSRLVRNRFGEALPFFERALGLPGIEDQLVFAVALNNAGICHARLGSFDQAIAYQERAIAAHEQRGVDVYLEQTLGELGNTLVLRGTPEAALPHLSRAFAVASAAGLAADAALWAGNLAVVHVELGRWDDAEHYNEAAIAQKRAAAQPIVHNVLNRGRIAAGRGNHAAARSAFGEALEAPDATPAIRWEAHAGMAAALREAGRTREAIDHYERALAVVAQSQSGLLQPEFRITFLSRLIRFHRAYVDLLVDLGRHARALEVADASRARVLADGQTAGPPAPATHAALLRLAAARRERLVAFWLAPRRSFAWVLGGGRTHLVELPGAEVVARLVADYRAFVETALGDPLRSSGGAADVLSAAVLEPVARYIPAGSRVTVVPDGPLHGVNLEALPVGMPRRYWIEDVTVTIAPSLSLLTASGVDRAPPPAAVLLIGDPAAAGVPPLRHAGAELDAIGRAFPQASVEVYRGRTATPAAYRASRPDRFSIIHFAAHATVTAASPLDSAIELSPDGSGQRLFAREIAAVPLQADLVTISACRGAGAKAYAGEGLVGLAWALLRAGAHRVVAGLWDVDDQSTARLMEAFYTRVAAGDSAAAALRSAKLAMLASGGNFAKPYYWAPFQVFAATRA